MDQPPWFGTHMVCGLIERFNHLCVWLPHSRCNSSLAIQNHIVIPINKSSLKYIKWCLSVAKPIIHTFSLWPKTFCFQVVCLDIRFLWTWYLSLEGFFFFQIWHKCHLETRMNWSDFCGQRSKIMVTVTSHLLHSCEYDIPGTPWGKLFKQILKWLKHALKLKDELIRFCLSKVTVTCPSHFHECNIPGTPEGTFITSGTNHHLDSWIESGGQRSLGIHKIHFWPYPKNSYVKFWQNFTQIWCQSDEILIQKGKSHLHCKIRM